MSTIKLPISRPRAGTTSGPHALSLKVLRLSRPTLATHTPLPPTAFGSDLDLPNSATLAYPNPKSFPATTFPLTPLLTLPSSFGAAYVGETFACTLCANNELLPAQSGGGEGGGVVRAVKIAAELQSPSHRDGIQLELFGEDEEDEEEEEEEENNGQEGAQSKKNENVSDEGTSLSPGQTLQRTLRHELKEEGPHVLAVTVTYTEGAAAGEAQQQQQQQRTRTFRKLYQFVAQQLVAVRSKITERKTVESDGLREWVLEAQLENIGESSVVIEEVALNERPGMKSRPVNSTAAGAAAAAVVVLKPQDVEQVMFIVREGEKAQDALARVPLAQMKIGWRSGMGEKGGLTTGWLASRGR